MNEKHAGWLFVAVLSLHDAIFRWLDQDGMERITLSFRQTLFHDAMSAPARQSRQLPLPMTYIRYCHVLPCEGQLHHQTFQ